MKKYLLDLDGTLVVRGPPNQYPIGELIPNSLLETDAVVGADFEGRAVYFMIARRRIPIYFRFGLRDFLAAISNDGECTIVIATHACRQYAERIRDYLASKVVNMRMKVQCFTRPQLKVAPADNNYEFILEDKPERWINGTKRLIRIPELTVKNVGCDNKLVALTNELTTGTVLRMDSFVQILDFNPMDTLNLTRCSHCSRWKATELCASCGIGADSDTDHSDEFESDSSQTTSS